jgi:transcriptional regulator with XRE-family HTH domain
MTGKEIRKMLAKNIKNLRTQKGMSQALLAEKADISVPFISAIEQCSKWPYPDTLAQIATALKIEVSDLFITKESEEKDKKRAIELMTALVDSQRKTLDDFAKSYLK